MHFSFYTSAEEEKKQLIQMFRGEDPLGVDKRVRQYLFPTLLARHIHNKPARVWDKRLTHFLEEIYNQYSADLRKARTLFTLFWRQHDATYFKPLEAFFGHEIPPYHVLLSHFIAGASDWHGTEICTNAYSFYWNGGQSHAYFLLFEVILSQVFMRMRARYEETELPDRRLWAISETAAFTILHRLFDTFDFITKTNYPQVDPHLKAAQLLLIETGEIDAFLEGLKELIQE